MSRVTRKLQVTIPKKVADAYGIEPGSEIDFEPAGEVIVVHPAGRPPPPAVLDVTWRLKLFDESTQRQAARDQRLRAEGIERATDRGWTRAELYERGLAR